MLAVLLKKPNVYGSVFRFEASQPLCPAPGRALYRCLFPNSHLGGASCAEGGVLGVLPVSLG